MKQQKERGMFTLRLDGDRIEVAIVSEWTHHLMELRYDAATGYLYGWKADGENARSMDHYVSVLRRVCESGLKAILRTHDQVVYDDRWGEYVKVSDVKGPEWKTYRDDYVKIGRESCLLHADAPSREQARDMMLAKAAKIVAEAGTSHAEDAIKWLQAGAPVIALDRWGPVVTILAKDILARWEAKAQEEAQA